MASSVAVRPEVELVELQLHTLLCHQPVGQFHPQKRNTIGTNRAVRAGRISWVALLRWWWRRLVVVATVSK